MTNDADAAWDWKATTGIACTEFVASAEGMCVASEMAGCDLTGAPRIAAPNDALAVELDRRLLMSDEHNENPKALAWTMKASEWPWRSLPMLNIKRPLINRSGVRADA